MGGMSLTCEFGITVESLNEEAANSLLHDWRFLESKSKLRKL